MSIKVRRRHLATYLKNLPLTTSALLKMLQLNEIRTLRQFQVFLTKIILPEVALIPLK